MEAFATRAAAYCIALQPKLLVTAGWAVVELQFFVGVGCRLALRVRARPLRSQASAGSVVASHFPLSVCACVRGMGGLLPICVSVPGTTARHQQACRSGRLSVLRFPGYVFYAAKAWSPAQKLFKSCLIGMGPLIQNLASHPPHKPHSTACCHPLGTGFGRLCHDTRLPPAALAALAAPPAGATHQLKSTWRPAAPCPP
jgi:hypothetical protein